MCTIINPVRDSFDSCFTNPDKFEEDQIMASCADMNLSTYQMQEPLFSSAVDQTLGIFRGFPSDMDSDMMDMSFLFSLQGNGTILSRDGTGEYSDEISSCDSDKDVSYGSDDCFSDADTAQALNEAVMEIINKDKGRPPPSYEDSINKFIKPAVTLPATITKPPTTNNTIISNNQSKVQELSNHSNKCKDKPICPIKLLTDVKIKKEILTPETESTEERKGRPPRNCSSIYSAANFDSKPVKKIHKPRVKKTIHLWEFLEEIVENKDYSPKYITWVSREQGVFRLVDSKAVARLWGLRKNRHDMTYEKMSRAIRYYYERGIIRHVMGQKLIYQFGDEINEKRREKLTKSSTAA